MAEEGPGPVSPRPLYACCPWAAHGPLVHDSESRAHSKGAVSSGPRMRSLLFESRALSQPRLLQPVETEWAFSESLKINRMENSRCYE